MGGRAAFGKRTAKASGFSIGPCHDKGGEVLLAGVYFARVLEQAIHLHGHRPRDESAIEAAFPATRKARIGYI